MATPKLRIAMTLVRALGTLLVLICISSGVSRAQASPSATPTPTPPPTLRMSIVYPSNGVLYQNGPDTIQAAITLEPPPTVAVHKYKVVIAVSNAAGQMTKDHSYRPNAIQSVANVKMKKVPAGEYFVAANVYDKKNTLVGTAGPFEVIKMDVESSPTPTSGPTATATPVVTPTATPTATRTVTATITSTPTTVPPTATPTAKPTAAIISPLSGSAVSGVVNVSVKPESGASSTDIYIDGAYWTQWSANPTPWNSTTVSNGPHTIGVHSVMSGTTTGVNSIGFTVNNSTEATATQTATATLIATATTTTTVTATSRATSTATPTTTFSAVTTPTATTTRTVTATSTATPTTTRTAVATPTATATATSTATRTVVATPTSTATATATATLTVTATRTATASPTPTGTVIATHTATATPTATSSPTSGLDQYGGTTSVQCPNGPAAHFYTQKIGSRWWLCDPAGNGFFLKGVYAVEANVNSAQTSAIQSKYAGPLSNWEANWSLEQVRRLQSWGFNTVADYSIAELTPAATDPAWGTSDNTIPVKMPFSVAETTTHDAFQNVNSCGISSPLKDMMNGVGSAYTGYRYGFGDYFDPNFATCAANVIANDTWGLQQAVKSKYSSYLLYITIDESDQTGFLDQGADFPSVGPTGQSGSGPSPSAHVSWITLVTAPTQTSNSSQGVSYTDTTVHTKQELSQWLAARYANNIASLNSAWGSNYSTFGASGAGWGVGSGILDENGTCPAASSDQSCWVGDPATLAGETAAMQSDMSAFYSYYLDQYFSVMTSKFNAAAPGVLLQMQLGGWGAPPRKEVLTEAAKYLTLPILSQVPTWPCTNCSDTQAELDFTVQYLGDSPWINWVGYWAQPDSAESAYATTNPGPFSTQEQRGASYQSMLDAFVTASDTNTGSYHVVGFDWWSMYDMNSQQSNWGLLTPHDNPYDGKSSTTSGSGNDQWGYPTGGEAGNYGDFVDDAKAANSGLYSSLMENP